MSTTNRPEISKKNRYWISRHRFYELKHFCLQYYEWNALAEALLTQSRDIYDPDRVKGSGVSDPTFHAVVRREYYQKRMDLVKSTAKEAGSDLWPYLFKAVTEGISYEHLLARTQIPCCKDVYYEMFRRFFWMLSKQRK